MGGAQYHVAHTGWPQLRNFPGERVRSEARRLGDLSEWSHAAESLTGGRYANIEFPFTLDLRKSDG